MHKNLHNYGNGQNMLILGTKTALKTVIFLQISKQTYGILYIINF